ncbi:MAG: APC family permease [Spiroplasma sp.]|nr:APC family permease [Spiroplasma sp.]
MAKKLNWNFFKKKPKDGSNKLSLPELVWFGFNYTAGISFTAVFATLLYGKTGITLGTHMIWIFLVEGLIAGTCAWAFARLSQVHAATNGAAYIYTRSSYGRFWGWLIAFVQYSTLPVVVTSQIISMIRINFTDPSSFLYANWGVWSNFGLDLIGIAVYGLVSCVLFLGMRAFKYFVNFSAYIKWITTFLLIGAVIALFVMAGTSNYKEVIAHQNLTANSFSEAFTSCFFFFLGFETYSTIGKNVKNPQKNISRSIIIVMFLATLFYVLVTALMIGAITGLFSDNPNLQIFELLGDKANAQWLGTAGVLIMLICTISLKANAGMQNALYSGGILEPLAFEGYIPTKYKELNKDGIAFKASRLNLIITFIFAFTFLVIPDLAQAISDTVKNVDKPSTVLNYGTITGEASFIMIIIYSFVISIALKLSLQKKLRHNKFEFTIWSFGLLFLIWQLVMWFINLVNSFSSAVTGVGSTDGATSSAAIVALVSNSLQIFYIVFVFAFAIIWYLAYYQPKLNARLVNNEQNEYDKSFVIKDDWAFVAKSLQSDIDSYLARNIRIHNNPDDSNYKLAQKVRSELIASEGELQDEEDLIQT